ncbi:uncharacterized protein LOC143723309 [Siphateles boraxobius]|uniref:uncharacterized protein LOC143723309 n=1 Tax=Siphateles boraxobius TaxID=180520 RepID=UPI004063D848
MPETIVDTITAALPNLDEDRMKSLVERLLLVVGVEEVSDLIYVKEDDINDILTPLQCCKLMDGFQRRGHSIMTASRWMLSIEGKVLLTLDNSDNFILAFAVLFASYYIFNIEYQESAACTLELAQRFLVRINPEDGNAIQSVKCTARQGISKRTKRVVQRKVTTINPHVNSFILSLMEFEWKTSN